ncbi:hypothetical protein BT93_A0934 [Corymbia citriodora subsp. variegata]|nr:hypothetical protein BT93_A0934 [Corymbia citriodora subsp. variegata]
MKGNRVFLTDLGNSTTCRTKQNQEKTVLEHAIGSKQKYYLRSDGRICIIILKGYMSFK